MGRHLIRYLQPSSTTSSFFTCGNSLPKPEISGFGGKAANA
jgi:hypothetical protein